MERTKVMSFIWECTLCGAVSRTELLMNIGVLEQYLARNGFRRPEFSCGCLKKKNEHKIYRLIELNVNDYDSSIDEAKADEILTQHKVAESG